MPHSQLEEEFRLLHVRKKCLHIAMKLFETITEMDELTEVGDWLNQSAVATDKTLVEEAHQSLIAIAVRKNIVIDQQ